MAGASPSALNYVLILDQDGRVRFLNHMREGSSLTSEMIVGNMVANFLPAADRARFDAVLST